MTPLSPLAFPFKPEVFQPRPGESMTEYWLSLSPMAPFFGVDWRMMQVFEMGEAAGAPAKPAAKKPAPKKPAAIAKVAVAAEPAPAPAPKPAPQPAPAATEASPVAETPKPEVSETKVETRSITDIILSDAPEGGSDLTRIKGIGEKLAVQLKGMGLFTVDQIAQLSETDLDWIDERLTAFRGRSRRDDWIGQAKAMV